jgi:hypothetical protein
MRKGVLIYKLVIEGGGDNGERIVEMRRMVESFIDSFTWIDMQNVTLTRKSDEIEKAGGSGAKVRRVTYYQVKEECPYLQLLNSLSEVEIFKSQIY